MCVRERVVLLFLMLIADDYIIFFIWFSSSTFVIIWPNRFNLCTPPPPTPPPPTPPPRPAMSLHSHWRAVMAHGLSTADPIQSWGAFVYTLCNAIVLLFSVSSSAGFPPVATALERAQRGLVMICTLHNLHRSASVDFTSDHIVWRLNTWTWRSSSSFWLWICNISPSFDTMYYQSWWILSHFVRYN